MAFWGLVVGPNKTYSQTVEAAFHMTKACLDLQSGTASGITSLYLDYGGDDFILCNLDPSKNYSTSLNLLFVENEGIALRTEGKGTIHISGYYDVDPDDLGSITEDESLDEAEETEETPTLVNGSKTKKRKTSLESGLDASNSSKKTKMQRFSLENGLKSSTNAVAKAAAVKKAMKMKKKIAQESEKIDQEGLDSIDSNNDDDYEDIEDIEDVKMESEEEEENVEEDEEEDVEEDEDEKLPKKNMTPKRTPSKNNSGDKTPGQPKKTPNKDGVKTSSKKDSASTPIQPKKSPKHTLKGGIVVEELKPGSGAVAKRGKLVGMYYVGRIATTNKKFDAKLTGNPFRFKLGMGDVIKGWDIGLEGIRVGGKRKLIIPPKMGYGNQNIDGIPPNSTLVFEVECTFVK